MPTIVNSINYDEISKIYDDVRDGDLETINSFLEEVQITKATQVLDIGCGTGNFTYLLQNLTKAQVCGADQSAGMLEKAKDKCSEICFTQADACSLPYQDNSFDFVYMTDVIHHIPDISELFGEISRILKPSGRVCIHTQSHKQINERFFNLYFPGTAIAEKKRYPDSNKIITSGEANSLRLCKQKELYMGTEFIVDREFLQAVEKKGFSMFYLISDEEYQSGLEKLRQDLSKGSFTAKAAGYTQIWFTKYT